MKTYATAIFTLAYLQSSNALTDWNNGTNECEKANIRILEHLDNAEEKHSDYESADRLMHIAFTKAYWPYCRNCKDRYLKYWDQLKTNDAAIQDKFKLLTNENEKIT